MCGRARVRSLLGLNSRSLSFVSVFFLLLPALSALSLSFVNSVSLCVFKDAGDVRVGAGEGDERPRHGCE